MALDRLLCPRYSGGYSPPPSLPLRATFGLLMAALIAYGFFINAVQSTLFALCAFAYPTPDSCSRGVACAVSIGQVGAVLAGITGVLALSSSGARFYLMLSGALLLVLTSLATIRRHIPANR